MYLACQKDGFFFVAGDHTQLALKKIKADFPQNKMWRVVTGEMIICHRTPENLSRLKSWGILDNVKGDKRRTVTFEQKVTALHEDHVELIERMGKTDPNYRSTLVALKLARRKDYNMNNNSFGQLWGLASRIGPVWKLLEKIITGNVERPKRFTPPKSASPFTTMANIPDKDLIQMLNKVVEGSHTMAQFRTATMTYKARARVQLEILMFPSIAMKSWSKAKQKYPNTCNTEIVGMWAQHILETKLKNKQKMPPRFFSMVQQRLNLDKSLNASNKLLNTVSYCMHMCRGVCNITTLCSDVIRVQGILHEASSQPNSALLSQCSFFCFQTRCAAPELW